MPIVLLCSDEYSSILIQLPYYTIPFPSFFPSIPSPFSTPITFHTYYSAQKVGRWRKRKAEEEGRTGEWGREGDWDLKQALVRYCYYYCTLINPATPFLPLFCHAYHLPPPTWQLRWVILVPTRLYRCSFYRNALTLAFCSSLPHPFPLPQSPGPCSFVDVLVANFYYLGASTCVCGSAASAWHGPLATILVIPLFILTNLVYLRFPALPFSRNARFYLVMPSFPVWWFTAGWR